VSLHETKVSLHETMNVYKKFDMNAQARYSITKPYEAEQITDFIKKHVIKHHWNPEDCIITDATAGVGGDSINFSKYFRYVNAVEIDEDTFGRLNNNINSFAIKNIYTYHEDYTKDLIKTLVNDIIYIDFPWGGVNYKHKVSVDLYLSELSVLEIIEKISNETKVSFNETKVSFNESKPSNNNVSNKTLIFIKVPFNVNIIEFEKYIEDTCIILNKASKPSFKVLKISNKPLTNIQFLF